MLTSSYFLFHFRGRSSNKREPIKSFVTTATSSSTPSAPNGSPTPHSSANEAKKPSKNRAVVNTSGIAKYLGKDDKKVVLAKRDVEEDTNEKKGLLGINKMFVLFLLMLSDH